MWEDGAFLPNLWHDCTPAASLPPPLSPSLPSHLALCRTQMFDRATKHPNATVVSWSSPRVVLIRDFLAPDEIEHLVQQATGTALGRMAAAYRNCAGCGCTCTPEAMPALLLHVPLFLPRPPFCCGNLLFCGNPLFLQAGLSAARW